MEDKNSHNWRRLATIASHVGEDKKIRIDEIIRRFQGNHQLSDYTFPNALTSHERAYIHAQAGQLGLKSQSDGVGAKRKITLSKPMGNDKKILKTLQLNPASMASIHSLEPALFGYTLPLPALDFLPNMPGDMKGNRGVQTTERSGFTNRLFTEPGPKIPKPRQANRYDAVRKRLPIWNFQESILDTIRNNNVIFIKGDTGCGKTTQVPQFILDDAMNRRERVRIVCTVPRRIAAITISDRVAIERGEKVGHTVGYQIRLESCISPCDTILTYCTSGILLRSLTSFDYSILKNTTHIIIDEVHERDRQTEFLLACVRDVGAQFPNLKLILMGADMDTKLMTSYFGGPKKCPLIQVQGRLHPVEILYLEDILTMLQEGNQQLHQPAQPNWRSSRSFNNNQRQNSQNKSNQKNNSNNPFDNIVNNLKNPVSQRFAALDNLETTPFANFNPIGRTSEPILQRATTSRNFENNMNEHQQQQQQYNNDENNKTPAIVHDKLNSLIMKMWRFGDNSAADEFVILLKKEKKFSVDYRHSQTKATMLMACAVRGRKNHVETLLSMGADTSLIMYLEDGRNYTAKDWAIDHKQQDVVQAIEQHEYSRALLSPSSSTIRNLAPDVKERLDRYQTSRSDERVDLQLIVDLLFRIHINQDYREAVLVFLPGYEDIVTLKQMIFTDRDLGNLSHNLTVFLLHSNIQSGDQRAVFELPKYGRRKIVLSTNIAETSLTIEDIVFVIDSGRVKEKSFDSMTGVSQLRANWISKASANQRKGRAGRCRAGQCFRLYSSTRYDSMNDFPIAEIVRSSLQELCLYTRSFIREELKIKDFFTRLPEPPAPIAVKKSVEALVSMGALDGNEQLTKLGLYLLDFPIEPYLGKALMYAVTLKCLDPILTIITIISHREPFQLPANPEEKKKALMSKLDFAVGSMSDHMASLRAFQDWEKSTLFKEQIQRNFCRDRFLSSPCFEMICGIRAQLVGQLRAAGFVQNAGANDLKDLNVNSENWSMVKGILTATLYPNICGIDKENNCLFNEYDTKVKFHSSSILSANRKKGGIAELPADWIIYDEMCQQDFSKSLRNCTVISDVPLALFGGNFTILPIAYDGGLSAVSDENNPDREIVKSAKRFDLNNWISFRGNTNVIDSILYLRRRLNELMCKRLHSPAIPFTMDEDTALQSIAFLLMSEDEARGIDHVEGIGQWPKMVSGNMMSTPRAGFERSLNFEPDGQELH